MTRVNRIASNKPELDMVLLYAYQASLGWELSGFVWIGLDEFGLVWLSLVGFWVWFFCVCG